MFPWVLEIMGYVCIFPLLRIIIISVEPGLILPHKYGRICGGAGRGNDKGLSG